MITTKMSMTSIRTQYAKTALSSATIAILLLSIFLPLLSISFVAYAQASISLNKVTGPIGTTITVTGTGFAANRVITLTVDEVGTFVIAQDPANLVTDTAGGFVATFQIGNFANQLAAGSHSIKATDGAGNVASQLFAITTPSISLSVTSGPSRTAVVVTGTGYRASAAINVATSYKVGTLTRDVDALSNAAATSAGAYTAAFLIPNMDGRTGSGTIRFTDDRGNTATATFTAIAPTTTLSASSGAAGSRLTITGTGFARSTALINATWDVGTANAALLVRTPAATTVDQDGGFTLRTLVPAAAVAGSHTVTVFDNNENFGTATFTITPSITVRVGTLIGGVFTTSNTNAGPGSATLWSIASSGVVNAATFAIRVTGTGFASVRAVTFTISPTLPGGSVNFVAVAPNSAANGNLAATNSIAGTWPAAGNYLVTATDAAGNVATATIVSVAGTFITLSPTSGPVGTRVTVRAQGFEADATVAPGQVLFAATASLDVSAAASATDDEIGNSLLWPTANDTATTFNKVVPNLAAGVYTVTFTSDPGYAATSTFTVTAAAPAATLSKTSGPVGTTVVVLASGMATGRAAAIGASLSARGVTVAPSQAFAEHGTGTYIGELLIPTLTAGAAAIVVSDGINTASATFTIVNPTITLSSTAGTINGTRLGITGSGFLGFLDITEAGGGGIITFGATNVLAASMQGLTTTDGGGNLVGVNASLPVSLGNRAFNLANFVEYTADALAGAKTITVSDGTNSATATYTVRARIIARPDRGVGGTTVNISGEGFAATSALFVYLDTTATRITPAAASAAVTVTTTLATGAFHAAGAGQGVLRITIPSGTSEGAHSIWVYDSAAPTNNTASVTFTLTAASTLTLSPTRGPTGTRISLAGLNWGPGRAIVVTIGGITAGLAAGSATVLANGSLALGVNVPRYDIPAALAPGIRTVSVTDGIVTQTADYEVVSTTATLSTITWNANVTTIRVSGDGFAPSIANMVVRVRAPDQTLTAITALLHALNTTSTDAGGRYNARFRAPFDLTAGAYTFELNDGVRTFPIGIRIAPGVITTPTTVLRGTTVAVIGFGFGASRTVTVSLDGTSVGTTTTSATGRFQQGQGAGTVSFNVPITAAVGTVTVTATDDATPTANSGTATLTLRQPTISLNPTSVQAGQTVQVTGSGFFVAASVQMIVRLAGTVVTTSPATITTSTGSFVAFFTVPAGQAAGSYAITAIDSNGNEDSKQLMVTAPVAVPTVDTTTLRDTAKTLDVNGNAATQFHANDQISAKADLKADTSGTVVLTIVLQDPNGSIVYPIYKFTFTITTQAQSPEAVYVLPSGAAKGTWTVRIQVTAPDGTPLAIQTLTITVV